ncbi:hypothetical protein BDW75DRAFT_246438 [Aspergillus navahoensis]
MTDMPHSMEVEINNLVPDLQEDEPESHAVHETDDNSNKDNEPEETEIHQTMDPSQDPGSQPSAVETALVTLQSASTSRSLSTTTLPPGSTLGSASITTFAGLLHEIRHQYTQLPPALFLDLFLEAQAIVGELFHQQARPLMQTLVEFEAIGTQITGFKEYMESDE